MDLLPLSSSHAPASSDEAAAIVRDCYASETPLYPFGGGTSLDFGLPARAEGVGLSLTSLNRVIDYPARDMTITVEAGLTMRQLAETLRRERQQFPIDVPYDDRATLGGVIATNWNGPRRFGLGTVRDYVIGIHAIDGSGTPFKGGGRVVKNVAGYDFCKLLTGSHGSLGVITQATLKVRPLPEKSLIVAASASSAEEADRLLIAISQSETTPVAVELLYGPAWSEEGLLASVWEPEAGGYCVAVALEGTEAEVEWMQRQLAAEWRTAGSAQAEVLPGESILPRLIEWPATDNAPLVLKAAVPPSGVLPFIAAVRETDPHSSILSHAGSGIVYAKFSAFPKEGLSRSLIGRLQPAAAALRGHVVLLRNPSGAEMTQQSVWGGNSGARELMRAVKRKFDPKDILNRGRFVI